MFIITYIICWLYIQTKVECILREFNDQLLYDIVWKGPEETKLGGISSEDFVFLTTKENDKYKCLLPTIEDDSKKDSENFNGPSPEVLLADILTQKTAKKCSYRLEPYWTYEVCHGEIVRQYHEEKSELGDAIKTDFILGKLSKKEVKDILTIKAKEKVKKVPMKRINNRETPYYSVVMDNGTPCDLSNGKPRLTTVYYICHPAAHTEVLSIKEVTTCEYEVIVVTPTLCQNPLYRVKAKPIHSIQCHSLDGAPRSPMKDESEYMVIPKHEQIHHKIIQNEKPPMKPKTFTKPIVDPDITKNFLLGKYCLIGGAGWWRYELCHGRFIRQFHQEKGKTTTVINLGFWDVKKHQAWISRRKRKQLTKNFVNHFYSNGDICDLTGKPREAVVKLICTKTSGQQISIYMTEDETCKYNVFVESSILCPLVESADENEMFAKSKQEL